jgi:hypothetical protein
MFAILQVLWIFVVDIFKSRRRLEAENLFLHHQLKRPPLDIGADLSGAR